MAGEGSIIFPTSNRPAVTSLCMAFFSIWRNTSGYSERHCYSRASFSIKLFWKSSTCACFRALTLSLCFLIGKAVSGTCKFMAEATDIWNVRVLFWYQSSDQINSFDIWGCLGFSKVLEICLFLSALHNSSCVIPISIRALEICKVQTLAVKI